jgi:hypothetical protein
VSAYLDQVGNIIYPPPDYNPEQASSIGSLFVYITTSIGPSTTMADVAASTTQSLAFYYSDDVTLFSGLTLAPGSYYLVIQTPIDTFVEYSRAPYVLGTGVSNVTNYFGENSLDFEPADAFDSYSGQEEGANFIVTIDGTPASNPGPEPMRSVCLVSALRRLQRCAAAADAVGRPGPPGSATRSRAFFGKGFSPSPAGTGVRFAVLDNRG